MTDIARPRKKKRIQPCPSRDETAAMLNATRDHAERAALLALVMVGGLITSTLFALLVLPAVHLAAPQVRAWVGKTAGARLGRSVGAAEVSGESVAPSSGRLSGRDTLVLFRY